MAATTTIIDPRLKADLQKIIHSCFFGDTVIRYIRDSDAPKAALDAAFSILADDPPDRGNLAITYMNEVDPDDGLLPWVAGAIMQTTTLLVQELDVQDHTMHSSVLQRILVREPIPNVQSMYILPMVESHRVQLHGISVLDLKPYPGSIKAFLDNPNYDPQRDCYLAKALRTAVLNYYGDVDDEDPDPSYGLEVDEVDVLFFETVFKHPRIIAIADFRPALALAIHHNVPDIVHYLLLERKTDSSMVNLVTDFPKFLTLYEGAREVDVLALLLHSRQFDFDLLRRTNVYTPDQVAVMYIKAANNGFTVLTDVLFRWLGPAVNVRSMAVLVWEVIDIYTSDVLPELMQAHAYLRSPELLNECLFLAAEKPNFRQLKLMLKLSQVDPVKAFQDRVHLLPIFRSNDARTAWLEAEILDVHGMFTLHMSIPFLPHPMPPFWGLVHMLMHKDYMNARMLLRTYPMLDRGVVDEYIYNIWFMDTEHIEATIVLMEDDQWNIPTRNSKWIRRLIAYNHTVCRQYFRNPLRRSMLREKERRYLLDLRNVEYLVHRMRIDGNVIADVGPSLATLL